MYKKQTKEIYSSNNIQTRDVHWEPSSLRLSYFNSISPSHKQTHHLIHSWITHNQFPNKFINPFKNINISIWYFSSALKHIWPVTFSFKLHHYVWCKLQELQIHRLSGSIKLVTRITVSVTKPILMAYMTI